MMMFLHLKLRTVPNAVSKMLSVLNASKDLSFRPLEVGSNVKHAMNYLTIAYSAIPSPVA